MTSDERIKEAVSQLKKRLKEDIGNHLYEDDSLFLRFLKARDFNVDATEAMLKKHLEFRRRYDVDNIAKFKQPEVLKKYLPFVKIGYDKDGFIVRYCPAGNVDWIGLDLSVKREDFAKRLMLDLYEDETDLRCQSEKLGKTVDKCVYIFNLEKLSFAQATNKRVVLTAIFMCDLYQNNYPERLKALYIINVVKSLLPNSILDKIKIYTDDSYKADLLKTIDDDVLPAFLGGKKTDPDGDPLCPSFISQGAPVPEAYYIHKSKKLLKDLPDIKKIVLTRATFYEIYQEVKEPGSYLEWEFETKCRDIGFGLFYQDSTDGEEKMKELISIQRIDTDQYAEIGMYLCEKSGTYVIIFDNTYSWLRAKEIFYRIVVQAPEEKGRNIKK